MKNINSLLKVTTCVITFTFAGSVFADSSFAVSNNKLFETFRNDENGNQLPWKLLHTYNTARDCAAAQLDMIQKYSPQRQFICQ